MEYKIKQFRNEKNISQEELARLSGVSRAIISGLESGSIKTTTTSTLSKIAEALGKKVSDLFFEQRV
ncbi:helix-turn-helix transcriptional regulator [Parablautia sp. Marseille-Q6255]|uniref:helix-turn-helix transcriptional regulator n=1 Tax=Parablautia sp. Marseille-Q6255 TaxID=3039593 RepID=UPI0024BC513E|nr:helix-turn-helix domain-containing protein [Parablautia sp. Marseille-Q6255]